ncbi:MAG: DsbA family protein [Patescibacteria group bacterium]
MDKQKLIYAGIGIVATFIFLVGAYYVTNTGAPGQEDETGFVPVAAELTPEDHTKWASESANLLVEYSDLQCPACANFHTVLEGFSQDPTITENITFVYRHFPLVSAHKNAQIAAYASEAAAQQGKFYEMIDILFVNQTEWENANNPRDMFIGYAEEIGLDTAQFESDLGSDAVTQKVQQDQQSGLEATVSGTPTFFLNGQRLNPATTDEFRQILIEAATTNPAAQQTEATEESSVTTEESSVTEETQ